MSSFRVFICSCPKVSNLKVKLLGYDQSESQTTRYRLDFWVSATPEDPIWVSLGGQAFFKGLQREWGRWGRGGSSMASKEMHTCTFQKREFETCLVLSLRGAILRFVSKWDKNIPILFDIANPAPGKTNIDHVIFDSFLKAVGILYFDDFSVLNYQKAIMVCD